jgi:hypothetical protein
MREISAIQAVAVECLKQQIAELWTAVRALPHMPNQAGEKTHVISQLAQLDQTVTDVDTTATMFCNRSSVLFNVVSKKARKLLLDKVELPAPARHALMHAPCARTLFTDAFKWITLGPSLVMARPGSTMDLDDPGVFLKGGKQGDPIVAPSYDPAMPLPFVQVCTSFTSRTDVQRKGTLQFFRFASVHWMLPPVTYYWTVPLILDHSYLVV